jgi:hypothetical protein
LATISSGVCLVLGIGILLPFKTNLQGGSIQRGHLTRLAVPAHGRERHGLVDTDGRSLVIAPHPADIQDCDGGGALLHVSRRPFPFIEKVFANSGYAGERVARATSIAIEIVRKNPNQFGFAVNPRRWAVVRFIAWIGRIQTLARNFEAMGLMPEQGGPEDGEEVLFPRYGRRNELAQAAVVPKR